MAEIMKKTSNLTLFKCHFLCACCASANKGRDRCFVVDRLKMNKTEKTGKCLEPRLLSQSWTCVEHGITRDRQGIF